jgi:purine-binding chemotaxis protein CheW
MGLTSLSARLPRVREEVEQVKQLVSFRIGNEEFGVDILMVQEIIRLTTITPIPNASRAILGMINLRGNIIPIVDLRWHLRLNEGGDTGPPDRKARILIIEFGNHVTGFIVDAVSEVIKVPVGNIEPTPDLVSSSVSSAYIQGVIKMAGRLIILLDFTQILRAREKRELEHLGTQAALIELEASNRDNDIRQSLENDGN